MEQTPIKRSGVMGLVIFAVLASGGAFIMLFGYGWTCGLGGDRLECAVVPKAVGLFSTINGIFILFLIALAIKPFLNSKAFKIILTIYLIFVAIVTFIAFSFQNGGILFSMVKGTETECKLLSDYSVGKSYCYTDLAKSTNDIAYCEDTEALSGCYKYFALRNDDVSLCPAEDDYCIQGVAEKLSDASLCQKIMSSYAKPQCYAIVAEKTNNPLLCSYSNASFVFCNGSNKKIEENPEAFITASQLDLYSEIINSNIKTDQKNVDLIKITAKTPAGIAALKEFQFTINGGSIFDVFPKFAIYADKGGNFQQITGGASFSNSKDHPSKANLVNAPAIVFPNQFTVFMLRVDTSGFQGTLQLLSVGATALGKTKVSAKIIGNTNIKISQ